MATSIVPLAAEVGTELCRVKMEGGSLGGYRCEILTENLSEREGAIYKCPICEGIMKDGSITTKREQMCACCLREGEQSFCDSPVRSTILSLKCNCPLSKRGCDWLGMLESVENHLTTCGHVYASCELMCGMVLTRDEMGRHVKQECSQREEACLHCSGVHKVCDMTEHVKVCGKVEVMCELGCGTCVRRESISSHKENECSEEIVVCPYEKYRCEVVGLKRRELKQHLEESRMLHMEMKLIAMEEQTEHKISTLREKVDVLVASNDSLKDLIAVLEYQMKIKDEEIEFLTEICVEQTQLRNLGIMKWNINKILQYFKPNMIFSYPKLYLITGFTFYLKHHTDALKFYLTIFISHVLEYDSLKWPLRAVFITRIICYKNIEDSLKIKSPIIEIQKGELIRDKIIGSIPLSTDLKDFIRSDSLDLEITVYILN